MIIKTKNTYACDACGQKKVSRYKVCTRYQPGYPCNSDKIEEFAYFDLCDEHSKEFDKLFSEERAGESGYPSEQEIKLIISKMRKRYKELLPSSHGAGI